MRQFTLLMLEWNNWNGFIFKFIGLEFGDFEGDLLGLSFAPKDYLCFSIFCIRFDVKSPFINRL